MDLSNTSLSFPNDKRDRIQLLSEDLIEQHPGIAMDVLGYSSKFGIQLGWHYLLDLIWILNEIEVSPGATVLEAGAGNGLLQFILASKGYRVVSVDMLDRVIPEFAQRFFDIREIRAPHQISHKYISHLSRHGARNLIGKFLDTKVKDVPSRIVQYASHILDSKRFHRNNSTTAMLPISDILSRGRDVSYQSERPPIIYYQCELSELAGIENASIDAVVSVSALEHNTDDDTSVCVEELNRVLKPNSAMYLTVSASHPESGFHEPSHSRLLNEQDTTKVYDLDSQAESNFDDYNSIFDGLKQSKYLKKWLAKMYFQSGDNGMPWGKWDPGYQPGYHSP